MPDLQAAHLADLMSHTALGNHEAFAQLYDLTVRRVYGTVLRVLRSPQHAEEVTQEIYPSCGNKRRSTARTRAA